MKKSKIEKDLRSPLAKARDEFFESDKGQMLVMRSFGPDWVLPNHLIKYLRNRLENAYIAGYDQGEKVEKAKYRANFLWPNNVGSVEEAGYEFANGQTEAYRRVMWKEIKDRIKAELKRLAAKQVKGRGGE